MSLALYKLIIFISLLFEFIGVFMITKGFANITIEDIKESTVSYAGSNPKMAKSLIDQKLDGQFGGIFLLIGIFLMITTIFINQNTEATITNVGCSFCFSIIIFSSLLGYKNEKKVSMYKKFNYTSDEIGIFEEYSDAFDQNK